MRYLVMADIHANLEALQAVLSDAEPHDAVIFLGDLVGYGPDPNECAHLLREQPGLIALVGNHDWAALGKINAGYFNAFARQAVEWTDRQLEPDVRAYLEGLQPKCEGEEFALAHGSPSDPIWEYLEHASQGPVNFAAFSAPFCLVGHTHVPRIFREAPDRSVARTEVVTPQPGQVLDLSNGPRMIINAGGVGQPRDGDPRAAYGILDTGARTFTFRRVAYPFAETQEKIRAAGLPAALASRLAIGI